MYGVETCAEKQMYGVVPCSNRDVWCRWCSTCVAIDMYGVAPVSDFVSSRCQSVILCRQPSNQVTVLGGGGENFAIGVRVWVW